MKAWAIDYLCCPRTRAPLTLRDEVRSGDEIVSGRLVTTEGREYGIVDGVARLVVGYVSPDEEATAKAFSAQWTTFRSFDGFMGSLDVFFTHFPMLQRRDFAGKVVLDAGCGNGRFLGPVAQLGAERVIGLDFSESVGPAHHQTQHLPNVTVVQGSILEPPVRDDVFDLIFSMGVIDHLDDPEAGMRKLGKLLRPEGHVCVWIYAHEGNETYLRLVKPLRRIGPKLPPWVLLNLSRMLAVPVWVHSRTVNRWFGVRQDGSFRLPMAGYFKWLLGHSFSDIVCTIYDQLSHPLARYYRKEQAESLFRTADLDVDELHAPRRNSWSIYGKRLQAPVARQAARVS